MPVKQINQVGQVVFRNIVTGINDQGRFPFPLCQQTGKIMLQRFYHCPGAQIRTSDAYHNKNLRLV
jgi:hypothetical protein